jgi:tRNA(Ile2) C34 agmatinyltransferase TiaS
MEQVRPNITRVMASVMIRCKKCRRPMATSADRCPDCGALSPRGARNYAVKVVSMVVAVVALTATLVLAIRHLQTAPKEETRSVGPALSPAESSGRTEVSFSTP